MNTTENLSQSNFVDCKIHGEIIENLIVKVNYLFDEVQKLNLSCDELMEDNQNWKSKYKIIKNNYEDNIEKGSFLQLRASEINKKSLEEKISILEEEKEILKEKLMVNKEEIKSINKKIEANALKNLPYDRADIIYRKEIERLKKISDNMENISNRDDEQIRELNYKFEEITKKKKELEENLLNKLEVIKKEMEFKILEKEESCIEFELESKKEDENSKLDGKKKRKKKNKSRNKSLIKII